MSELEGKLTQLKRLLDLGLIDEADFAKQKDALLAVELGSGPSLGGVTRVADATLPERLGSYQVLGELGAGGMGRVVRARHVEEGWARRQGGDVAIKLIHPHIASEPGFRERFFAEAELGRKVTHDSVATVFDVLADGDHLATVMSLVEGRELSAFVRPGGMPLAEAVALLWPLAEALDHLHGLGIIHRDLKPANVKVRSDGKPVLLDLGIAKDTTLAHGQTMTSTAMGTAGWMAPEQADAKRVGPAADRYALGAIAYALLSGRMPWADTASEARILSNKLAGNLLPLGDVSGCSAETSDRVMGMLSLEPAARPASCAAFVAGLVSPPSAAPASPQPKPAPEPVSAPVPEPVRAAAPVPSTPVSAPGNASGSQANKLLVIAAVGVVGLVLCCGGLAVVGAISESSYDSGYYIDTGW
ncbi:MAG: protein kinase [Proteobacteria bacterium]|nr:protein kinase [Pseudomonadota bacterium]MCP4916002.1 protein kinase [Pseudomonadota bacterium]